MNCRTCAAELPAHSAACPRCGSIAADPTGTVLIASAAPTRPAIDPARHEGKFVSGTLLGGRYRIVGLIGRGGMGEVYRASDVKLQEAVALKFLPERAASDVAALARLHAEVRVAHQVSHPNVCRVYDIVSADGLHFISMEYIDGEDLRSLLRRIGRVPADKALEIARALCAGLAAAHEKGVLHRDLKPANIMIDGNGRVRIADFGLAGLAANLKQGGFHSGTPQYMAPEQIDGEKITAQSDIYSLGLVLYELFTGRRAYEVRSAAELRQLQRTPLPPPSLLVSDIDPAVEQVILACADPDARRRPASAIAVAAALANGDPVSAALAAGQTPSPEVLAASSRVDALSFRAALACFAAIVVTAALMPITSDRTGLIGRTGLAKPPQVLAQHASECIRLLGYTTPPADTAHGFTYSGDQLRYLEDRRGAKRQWFQQRAGDPSPIAFWYRESPRVLESDWFGSPPGAVTRNYPAPTIPGMVGLTLDPVGRLTSLHAVPPQVDASDPHPPASAAPLFAAAGLDASEFIEAKPEWTPPVAHDARYAWVGSETGRPLRIEAAYWRGRPVYFDTIGPWKQVSSAQPQLFRRERIARLISVFVYVASLIAGAFVARYNVQLKRADVRGAARLAGFVFALQMLWWASGADHVASYSELRIVFMGISRAAYHAGTTWMLYLAIEPFVRRRWPGALISWSRVLAGRFQDPLVATHVLIGVVFGCVETLIVHAGLSANDSVRLSNLFAVQTLTPLLGGRHMASQLIWYGHYAVGQAMICVFILFLFRVTVRRLAPSIVMLLALMTAVLTGGGRGDTLVQILTLGSVLTCGAVALVRFGVLATIVTVFTVSLLTEFPLTWNLSIWYADASLAALTVVLALAVFGFYTVAKNSTASLRNLFDA